MSASEGKTGEASDVRVIDGNCAAHPWQRVKMKLIKDMFLEVCETWRQLFINTTPHGSQVIQKVYACPGHIELFNFP